jgi:hypothetical protein
MKKGVWLICVTDESMEAGDKYPTHTGIRTVIKEEALRRMIPEGELLDTILKKRMCYVPLSDWTQLGLPTEDIPPQEG